jgi:predicted permease
MRTRVFALLLRLFPREFQSQLGGDLRATARALDRDSPVPWTRLGPIVIDAVVTLYGVRREMRAESRLPGPSRRRRPMDGILKDVQAALRGLRREPVFTTFVIATLMLGIGANAAMFGIADRLLLRGPALVRDADRVVRVYLTTQPPGQRTFTTSDFGHVTFDLLRRSSHTFDAVATYTVNGVVIGDGDNTRAGQGGYASAGLFPLLGVTPTLGRSFTEADDRPGGAAHVAILSDAAWRSRFGAARDVVGQSIAVGAERYEIVGVAPAGFTGPQLGPADVWMPINLLGPKVTAGWQTTWQAEWLHIVARLKPGVTRDQAGEEATRILQAGYAGDEPYVGTGHMTVASLTANDAGVEGLEISVLRWMSGVALIVLLIACANVANLLLARGLRRSREVALRSALGADRARLVRLLLVESMLLAFGGAAAGVGVAYLLGTLARTIVFSWVDWSGAPVNGLTLAVSAALAVFVGFLVGLVPALRATRTNLADSLKSGPREGGGPRSRLRHALTVVQAALSVVLLVGAGLFVRSLWEVQSLHLGFDPDSVLTIELSRSGLAQVTDLQARDVERARRRLFPADALESLRAIPGVERASLAAGMPFGNRFTIGVRVPGLEKIPQLKSGGPSVSAVAPDYFATMGTRILRGRAFGPADRAGSEPVAIVNVLMAQTIWPDRDAIGQCLVSGADPAPCSRIVGVAEDTYISSLREDAHMHYYVPFGQETGFGGAVLLVRAADPPAVAGAIKRALLVRDPTIRFVTQQTIQAAVDKQTRPWRIGATVFSLSGLLAVLVAAIGIYSVTAYLVADRTHEIGVRVALGATRGNISRLVVGTSVGMASVGVGLGVLGAVGASHFIEPLLFNESARDPWVYGAVGLLLVSVALVAAVVPAIRANRIDPLEALRAE